MNIVARISSFAYPKRITQTIELALSAHKSLSFQEGKQHLHTEIAEPGVATYRIDC